MESDSVSLKDFLEAKTREELAYSLGLSLKALCFRIYGPGSVYRNFEIPKRRGGVRTITSPHGSLKTLQRRLAEVLSQCYRPRNCVHGFVRGRSVKSNSEKHCKKTYVFNIDLKDFFPSINFGRVRGLFLAEPFLFPEEVATTIAKICCYDGTLPQGAPSSPIISNMICSRLDGELQQLARRSRCWYTRFADDLTFSTDQAKFPEQIAVFDFPVITPGQELAAIIERNGFQINVEKVRLQTRARRQEVTGIVVNRIPNIRRTYYRALRAALHHWESTSLEEAAARFSKDFNTTSSSTISPRRFQKIIRGRIEYLGMIRGKSDSLYLQLCDRYHDIVAERDSSLPMSPMRRLREDYLEQKNFCEEPRRRGKILEGFLRRLASIADLKVTKDFTRSQGGEQIDGGFKYDGYSFIVECKWEVTPNPRNEVNVFIGKVGNSGGMTMGLFISINGYSKHCAYELQRNNDSASQRIILMDGGEFEAILDRRISFSALLEAKMDHLSLEGEHFYSVTNALKEGSRFK